MIVALLLAAFLSSEPPVTKLGSAGQIVELGRPMGRNSGDASFLGQVPYWSPVHWSNGPPGPTGATYSDARSLSAFDAADGYTVVLKFNLIQTYPPGETWTLAGNNWTNRTSTAGQPACCSMAPLTYDASAHEVVYLSANISSPAPTISTWTFTHGTWSESSAPGPPGLEGRFQYDFAYDANDGYDLLFGGATVTPHGYLPYYTALNLTWILQGGVWRNLTSSLAPAPPPDHCLDGDLACTGMTYSDTDREVILFGVGSSLNETWRFVAGGWSNLTENSGRAPPPTYSADFIFDARDNLSLLEGGWPGNPLFSQPTNRSWAYESGHWIQLAALLAPYPGVSPGSAVFFDRAADYLFLLLLGAQSWRFQVDALPVAPAIDSVSVSPVVVVLGNQISIRTAAAGGLGDLSFGMGGLPPGCANPFAETISCVPTASGSFLITITVSDLLGRSGQRQLTLTILSLFDVAVIVGLSGVGAVALAFLILRVRRGRGKGPSVRDAAGTDGPQTGVSSGREFAGAADFEEP